VARNLKLLNTVKKENIVLNAVLKENLILLQLFVEELRRLEYKNLVENVKNVE
jgi:hypothetical protein